MGAVQNLIASTGTAAEWEVVALAFISRARCLRASKAITAHGGGSHLFFTGTTSDARAQQKGNGTMDGGMDGILGVVAGNP